MEGKEENKIQAKIEEEKLDEAKTNVQSDGKLNTINDELAEIADIKKKIKANEKAIKEEKKETGKKQNPKKARQVKELVKNIQKAKTLMLVSIKSLPSKQFQEIKKSVREHAKIKVAKKNIMLRVIKELGKDSALELKKHIKEDIALAISDIEGFELAGILVKKKTPVFAKAGQIAVNDIEVKEGPTDLMAGPAISELGSLGIQIAVEDGKISIKASRVIVKEGQEINETAASVLQKLNIQPFSVGLIPLIIYDIESEKIYTNINIDSEKVKSELKEAASKALGFAQKIVYYCKETIGYFLGKANMEGKSLENLQPKEESKKETKTEEKKEEVKETSNDKQEKSTETESKMDETNEAEKSDNVNDKDTEKKDESENIKKEKSSNSDSKNENNK